MDEQLHDISTLNHGAEWTDMEAYLHEGTVILGCDNDYRRKKASYIFSHLQVSNFQNTLKYANENSLLVKPKLTLPIS